MSAVLFAPHGDDESLFAFYQCLRHRPHVIVVLRSVLDAQRGGATHGVRERETDCAMKIAGCTWEQWHHPDDEPNWALVEKQMEKATREGINLIIAPACEEGGHDHHNSVGLRAHRIARTSRVQLVRYLTYVRGYGRSSFGTEIVGTAQEQEQKLLALACYESQALWPPTAPWFPGGEYADLREWVA